MASSFASFYWEMPEKEDVLEELNKLLGHAMEFLSKIQSSDELVVFYQPAARYGQGSALIPK